MSDWGITLSKSLNDTVSVHHKLDSDLYYIEDVDGNGLVLTTHEVKFLMSIFASMLKESDECSIRC